MNKIRIGQTVPGGIGSNFIVGFVLAVLVLVQVSLGQDQASAFRETLRFTIENASDSDRYLIAKFNTDGTKLLLVRPKTADVFSTETGKKISSFESTNAFLDDGYEFDWQPGGSAILQFGRSFSKKAVAKLWDAETGKPITTLEESRGVQTAQWNARGDRLLTIGGSSSGGIVSTYTYSIRDQSGRVLRTERLWRDDLHSLGFSSAGDKLIGSFRQRKGFKPIRIMEIDSGDVVQSFDHGLVGVSSTNYAIFAGESPDGKYLCGQVDLSKGVTCWRADYDSKPIYSFLDSKETGDIHFAGFSPDSKSFAIIKPKPRTIELIDVESGKTIVSLISQNKLDRLHFSMGQRGITKERNKYGEFWSYDGKYFVLTDVEKEVSFWNIEQGQVLWKREAIWSTSYDWFVGTIPVDYEIFSFSRSTGLLLARSSRNVRVVEPATGKVIFEVIETSKKLEEGSFHRLISSWSPNGNSLITAAERNRTVILWTVNR